MKKYENFCACLKNMKELYDLFVQLKDEIDKNWL